MLQKTLFEPAVAFEPTVAFSASTRARIRTSDHPRLLPPLEGSPLQWGTFQGTPVIRDEVIGIRQATPQLVFFSTLPSVSNSLSLV